MTFTEFKNVLRCLMITENDPNYDAIISAMQIVSSEEYKRGYNDGYQDGHEAGYNDGYEQGEEDGYEVGYDDQKNV